MRIKYLWWILTCFLILSTTVACRTAPEPEPEVPPPVEVPPPPPPPPPPVVEDDTAAMNALNEAIVRNENIRQFLMDFDAPELLPSEWQSAESLYAQAEQQKNTDTIQNINESTARFAAAADAFEAMRDPTIALYLERMENALVQARNTAIANDAMVLSPDAILQADNVVMNAYELYQADELHAAREIALDALAMYSAIASGLAACRIREEIAEVAGHFASGALAEADAVALAAVARWEAEDFRAAHASADMALLMYARVGAVSERQRALGARANVAARQEFDSAQAVYARANSAYQGGNMAETIRLFEECRPMFAQASQLAAERQMLAEEALRLANERMAESDETAREAELILEGDM